MIQLRRITMNSYKNILAFLYLVETGLCVNFPGVSNSAASRLIFGRQTFSTATCTADGVALNTISLNIGEGRVFQSPNYPSNYPNLQECTYNFEPASGAQLRFSCSDVDLTATSSPGALCTGDYLRFYDENGQLGQSGTRYCFSDKPDFTYTTNIKVLFKTNNDANTGKGFDCQVVAEALATTTTTTTTTTPAATDCVTIDGPGATKPCKETFNYGYHRSLYKGCINQETPGQYLTVVPDFGDNQAAPTSANLNTNSVSFGTVSPLAPRSALRSSQEVRTLFWCATETDVDGYVSEWGKCAAGCKADPAGSYLPTAPRSGRDPDLSVGHLVELIQQSTNNHLKLTPPQK